MYFKMEIMIIPIYNISAFSVTYCWLYFQHCTFYTCGLIIFATGILYPLIYLIYFFHCLKSFLLVSTCLFSLFRALLPFWYIFWFIFLIPHLSEIIQYLSFSDSFHLTKRPQCPPDPYMLLPMANTQCSLWLRSVHSVYLFIIF